MKNLLFVLLILVVSCSKDDEPTKVFTSLEGTWEIESPSISATFTIEDVGGTMMLVSGEYDVFDNHYIINHQTEASLDNFTLKQDDNNYYVFKDLLFPNNVDNYNILYCFNTEYMDNGELSTSSIGKKELIHIK